MASAMNFRPKRSMARPQTVRMIFWVRWPRSFEPVKLAAVRTSSQTRSQSQWIRAKRAKAVMPRSPACVARARPTVAHQRRK